MSYSSESSSPLYQRALCLLRKMLGSDKNFRAGQWEAIEAVAVNRQRALLVQRTGWGKSLVYFLATKLLREAGMGPTLLISPLLSLMRNQIENAERIGIRAYTINSANQQEWVKIEQALAEDRCDLMLISPERLNNDHFLKQVLPRISGSIGLFVVDEAHCISDWGHDFRPDYRRIARILQILPQSIPVLGTTATANNRVIADIQEQFGTNLRVYRGPLARESLRLQNIRLNSQSERLAWLAHNLPKFSGSGIIYCLTVADTERVTGWLKKNGFSAQAYHAGNEDCDRPELEKHFLENKIKILVATVALGMGFDKPDIQFVIHFQRPGSVIAYYQQVGRAGRALEKSYGICLGGKEDDEIQNHFIDSAFPDQDICSSILTILEASEGMSVAEILAKVNTNKATVEKALMLLQIDGAVGQSYNHRRVYFRTPNPWKPDLERINRVLALRRSEMSQMQRYMEYSGCLMEFLQKALDDLNPAPCGRCANCKKAGFSAEVPQELILEAESYLKGSEVVIEPQKRWPQGVFDRQKSVMPSEICNAAGRALCYYGDAGWGKMVRDGKYQENHFNDELVEVSARLIRERWRPSPSPTWVTAITSNRHPELVPDFAVRLAGRLGLPYVPAITRSGDAPEQKMMQNPTMQARNVIGSLVIQPHIPSGPVLLVDDIVDSGWTMAMAGYLLRQKGSGIVYPFALALATGKA